MITPSQVESIFFAALDKKTTAERADYLDDACGDDAELRGRVERLLEAHPQAVDFLARPAVDRPDVAERDRETGPPKANESERPTVNDRPALGSAGTGTAPGEAALPVPHQRPRPTSPRTLLESTNDRRKMPGQADGKTTAALNFRMKSLSGRVPITRQPSTCRPDRSPVPDRPSIPMWNRPAMPG